MKVGADREMIVACCFIDCCLLLYCFFLVHLMGHRSLGRLVAWSPGRLVAWSLVLGGEAVAVCGTVRAATATATTAAAVAGNSGGRRKTI